MNIHLFLEVEPTFDPALDELIENLGAYVHATDYIRYLMREQHAASDPGIRFSLDQRLIQPRQQRRIYYTAIQENIDEFTKRGMTLSQLLDRLRALLGDQGTDGLEKLLIGAD